MATTLEGLIPSEKIALLKPLVEDSADYNHLRKTWKSLSEPYVELKQARALVSEELWERYKLLNIKGLPEQKIFKVARTTFLEKLKEITDEAQQETAKATSV